MAAITPCLTRSTNSHGDMVVRLGVPLLDDYLRFVQARARPNTVLATAYDLADGLALFEGGVDQGTCTKIGGNDDRRSLVIMSW